MARESSSQRKEKHDMTKVLEQLANTMKGIRSVRVAGPEERLFGGKGIVIPFRLDVPDQDKQARSPNPSVSESPGAHEPEESEEDQP